MRLTSGNLLRTMLMGWTRKICLEELSLKAIIMPLPFETDEGKKVGLHMTAETVTWALSGRSTGVEVRDETLKDLIKNWP